MLDCGWVRVDGENFRAFAQQIDEVSTVAAPSVENAHAGRDIATQDLIENIDVNFPEQFLDIGFHSSTIAMIPITARNDTVLGTSESVNVSREWSTAS